MIRALALVTVAAALLAACNDDCKRNGRCGACVDESGRTWDFNPWCLVDANVPSPTDASCPVISSCNILFQTGCNADEKCTWFHDDNVGPCSGDHVGCAPAGAKTAGETCVYGAPGAAGFDDCVGGAICIEGTCHTICDYQYGRPYCPDDLGCAKHDDFGPDPELPDFPLAGICVPTCDPIADNDFDGSGSASVRTGAACGPDPGIGCYGRFLNGGPGTEFTCARPVPGTENYVHRSAVPPAQSARTACHPGYLFAITLDTTGRTEFSCHAICRPGNSYAGAVTQEPNGQPGHQCRTDSGGRSGSFGTPASATENGEHCMYSWMLELDTSAIHLSATSDTVGICWDHTHFTIDHDGDYTTPQIAMPSCAELPLNPATGLGAEDFGCVESALAGRVTNLAPIALPPRLQ